MIELVWDADRSGTCMSSDGASLTAGDLAAWSPDDLLAMAAASCLMRTFLQIAAEEHVPVLGTLRQPARTRQTVASPCTSRAAWWLTGNAISSGRLACCSGREERQSSAGPSGID